VVTKHSSIQQSPGNLDTDALSYHHQSSTGPSSMKNCSKPSCLEPTNHRSCTINTALIKNCCFAGLCHTVDPVRLMSQPRTSNSLQSPSKHQMLLDLESEPRLLRTTSHHFFNYNNQIQSASSCGFINLHSSQQRTPSLEKPSTLDSIVTINNRFK
jgi:hypothetical protein